MKWDVEKRVDLDALLELESKASKAPYKLINHDKLSADNKLVPYSRADSELDVAMRNSIREIGLELKAAREVVHIARRVSGFKLEFNDDDDNAELLETAIKKYDEVTGSECDKTSGKKSEPTLIKDGE